MANNGGIMRVAVIGAGVMGLTAAFELARRGVRTEIFERRDGPGLGCSYLAGGMIAPWCERESAEPSVLEWGLEGLEFWTQTFPVAKQTGSLVVSPARDRPEILRFSKRTENFETCDSARIAAIEPDLGTRFPLGLYFPQEAMLDPRKANAALAQAIAQAPHATFHFSTAGPTSDAGFDWVLDCTGFGAREKMTDLRGVKGEMAVVKTKEVAFSRPLRMIHPRHPVYLVPRDDQTFMIGATMIENEEPGRVTVRALLELLGAAYTLHPAFAEAEIVETGADVRPAFSDHLPRLRVRGKTLYLNGAYRHGYLLSPAVARRAADIVTKGARFPEFDR